VSAAKALVGNNPSRQINVSSHAVTRLDKMLFLFFIIRKYPSFEFFHKNSPSALAEGEALI
jgi:hypothetical protein